MKFQYLGTAASEGLPALFCQCDICSKSRKKGGKHIRTRSQAIINDDLLIDFNADTFMHFIKFGIDSSKIKYCIVTHNHSDHFYPEDLIMRISPYSHLKEDFPLTVYGSEIVGKAMSEVLFTARHSDSIKFKSVYEFNKFKAGDYEITPLKALHGQDSGPLIYMISKCGKTILYAHDTAYFHESVWKYFEETKPYFNFVSLDCTQANDPEMNYNSHMNLADNIKVKERLLALDSADENTVFACNHFSHNGLNSDYASFEKIAAKNGFLTSYDGMKFEI